MRRNASLERIERELQAAREQLAALIPTRYHRPQDYRRAQTLLQHRIARLERTLAALEDGQQSTGSYVDYAWSDVACPVCGGRTIRAVRTPGQIYCPICRRWRP